MTRKKGKYEIQQSNKAKYLIKNSNVFNGDIGGKLFPINGTHFPKSDYLLNSRNNLLNFMTQDVIDYFTKNEIAFWKTGITEVDEHNMPTGHTLSSQISCINHLFPLRNDRKAVLAIAKTICSDIVDVFEITTDKFLPAYIAFETISENDYLNECIGQKPTRGTMCTSVDALIFAQHQNGKKILLPIEWKYTESYDDTDKSTEKGRGKTRLSRYTNIINNSTQLTQKYKDYTSSIYFFEPFYQLMRQTLLTEQMIANKDAELIKADDYIHAHIIPSENIDLLNKEYLPSKQDLETTWRSCLTNQEKYKIISPKDLITNIDKIKYKKLINYLSERYW